MYKNKEIRKEQFFVEPNWTGGVYACPTVAGSRPGSLIALTWASLIYFGKEGYIESTRKILSSAKYIKNEIAKIPGLRVMGDPKLSVVGFTSDVFNIFQLNELLSKGDCPSGKSWCLNVLQFPSSIHLCVTGKQTYDNASKEFVKDVAHVASQLMNDKNSKPTGMAALYGSSQMIPDRSLIVTLASGLLDAWYSTPEK